MSLTEEKKMAGDMDKEKEKFLLAAAKVKESKKKIYPELENCGEKSNFGSMDTSFLEELIGEYDFASPKEFREKLEKIWEKRNVPEMKVFSVPAAVALFKNKPTAEDLEKNVSGGDGKISEYIYEF